MGAGGVDAVRGKGRVVSQQYEWLVPVGHLGLAHAFVQEARLSVCVRHERWPYGEAGWEFEQLLRGEPRRQRCRRCQELIEATGLQEVTG
jgi:hypothetical protein